MKRRMRGFAVVFAVCTSCGPSEAEREAAAMAHAVPDRASHDGAIVLNEGDRSALGLVVEVVVDAVLPDVRLRFGHVRARPGDEALVVSPVAARVIAISDIALGAEVAEDTVLVTVAPVLGTVERVSLVAGTAELGGQIDAAARDLALYESTLTRVRELGASTVVSAQAVDEAERNVETTTARLAALRRAAGLRATGVRGTLALAAPRAGSLVAIDATLGSVVAPGDVLARVLGGGARLVDVDVPADEPVGSAFEVVIGDRALPASLVASGRTATGAMRTDRLSLAADDALMPGALVRVRVPGASIAGPVVPESALVPTAGAEAVYVERQPGIFEERVVVVAARFGGRARIERGLRAGERVVVVGAAGLRGEVLRGQLGHSE